MKKFQPIGGIALAGEVWTVRAFFFGRKRMQRKSVYGSTVRQAHGSPRTDRGSLKINWLAVHPECVEGRMANCDKVSKRLCRN